MKRVTSIISQALYFSTAMAFGRVWLKGVMTSFDVRHPLVAEIAFLVPPVGFYIGAKEFLLTWLGSDQSQDGAVETAEKSYTVRVFRGTSGETTLPRR